MLPAEDCKRRWCWKFKEQKDIIGNDFTRRSYIIHEAKINENADADIVLSDVGSQKRKRVHGWVSGAGKSAGFH